MTGPRRPRTCSHPIYARMLIGVHQVVSFFFLAIFLSATHLVVLLVLVSKADMPRAHGSIPIFHSSSFGYRGAIGTVLDFPACDNLILPGQYHGNAVGLCL